MSHRPHNSIRRYADVQEDIDAAYLVDQDPASDRLIDERGVQQRTVQPGRCFKGDGVAAYVNCNPSFFIPADNVTMVFWMYRQGTNPNAIFSFASGTPLSPVYDISINHLTNRLRVRYNSGSTTVNGTTPILAGTWNHVALTYNRITHDVNLFLNNVPELSYNAASSNPTGFSLLYLFTEGTIVYNNNALFDLRLYRTIKTTQQIADIMAFKPDLANLHTWWKMEEGSGTTVYDSSGNGRNGTVVNLYAGFHNTALNNKYSWQNEVGYNKPAAVFIPRNEANTINDILGNPLNYSGRVRYDGLLEASSCAYFDGLHGAACSSSYVAAADQENIIRWEFSYSGFTNNTAHQVVYGHSASNTSIGFQNNAIIINFGADWGYFGVTSSGRIVVEYNRTTADITVTQFDLSGNQAGTMDDNQPLTGTFEFDRIGSRNGANYLNQVKLWDLRIYKDNVLTDHWPCAEGYHDTLYNRISSRHAILSGHSRSTFWAQKQSYFHANLQYGLSLYEHASDPAIRVPLNAAGIAPVIAAPAGYAKTGDYPAGRWLNRCETKVDFTTNEPNSPHAQQLTANDPDMDEYTHGHALALPLWKHVVDNNESKFVFK